MSDFRLVDDHWMNFDLLRELWVCNMGENAYEIKVRDNQDDTYELFDAAFESREEAEEYLDRFMRKRTMGSPGERLPPNCS